MQNNFNYRNCQPNIGVDSYNGTLTFHFLNGDIALEEAEYGAYAICPGCGAGKTTAIKDFIRQKWDEGILYAAFTRDEVNQMYRYIADNLIGNSVINGQVLKEEDVIVLHSDYEADGTDKDLWFEEPEKVMSKKIVLCTHAKLLNEPLETLVSISFPRKSVLSKKMRVLTGTDTNIRNWILIDEGIDMKPVTGVIPKEALGVLGRPSKTVGVVEYDRFGKKRYVTKSLDDFIIVRDCNIYTEFSEIALSCRNKFKGFRNLLKPDTNRLNMLRNEQIIDELFDNFDEYVNNENEVVKLTYGLASWSMEGLKTHVLLFDGTSDITLGLSRKFKLLTYDNKYSSNVNLQIFPFSIDRRIKPLAGVTDMDFYLRDKLSTYLDNLSIMINQNQKTLIFCWKNFKGDNGEVNDDVDDGLMADLKDVVSVNKNLNLPKYIETELMNRGVDRNRFSIEYYGSGKDKATNEFRNYDAIVLFGKYNVPNSVISDFNITYHTGITCTEYYANRVIQAICRSRIRLHNGLPINIYFSSDWNKDVIDYVSDYLHTGIAKSAVFGTESLEFMINGLKSKGITPVRSEKIARLCTMDPGIYHAIMNDVSYETTFKLDDIFGLIPMSQKKGKEYNPLVKLLYRYKVKLNVISDKAKLNP